MSSSSAEEGIAEPEGERSNLGKPAPIISGWDNAGQDDAAAMNDDDTFNDYCSLLDDFGCEAYEDLAKTMDEKVYRWIRLEARKDDILKDIQTREDVLRKIEQVRSTQETHCSPAQLYRRQWIKTSESEESEMPSQVNGDRSSNASSQATSFSVLQFNALAEGLSSGPNVKTPFPIDKEGGGDVGFGGFTQIKFPEVCLDFTLRRWRLLEVILGITSVDDDDLEHANGSNQQQQQPLEGMFDILALEEMDRYRGFFAPLLRMFGYEGIFMPKTQAPGVRLGYYSDGCALFWKQNVFELLSEKRLKYKLGNQVLILATLQHKTNGIPLLVVVTHLKAQKSETNEKIRCRQVEEVLEHVQRVVKQHNKESLRVLIMGDFNADPPAHITFATDSCIGKVLDNAAPLCFQSAYKVDPPDDDYFTTWKTRGTSTVKRIIDYIFYTSGLQCTATLSVPKSNEMEEGKLPGFRYPSDHLMIGAEFDILRDD